MANLCARCYELLPETESDDGECPHCGLGYPGRGGPLQPMSWANSTVEPLTDEELRRRRQHRANDQAFFVSQLPFALLGLDDSWDGRRWVGGKSGGMGTTYAVELVHGGREEVPRATVNTVAKLGDGPRYSLLAHLEKLLSAAWYEEGEDDGLELLQAVVREPDPLQLWSTTSININAELREAYYVKIGSSNVTVAETDQFIISAVSAGIPREDIKLVDVDPRRYRDIPR